MNTLEKHNNEVQDNLMKLWDEKKEKLGLGEYSDEISLHIENQNTELLKKIAKEHFTEVNRILNLHSKTISEGGLDYKKAFEEMENYENKLAQVLEDLEK